MGKKAFVPSQLSGMIFDLNPDEIEGADDDEIASVYANGVTFTEATNKPLLKTGANGMNGKNILRFDGTNDILTSNANVDLSATQAVTAFIVANIPYKAATQQTIFEHGVVTSAGTFSIYFRTTGRMDVMEHGDVGYSTWKSTNAHVGVNDCYAAIMDMSLATNESQGYINGLVLGNIPTDNNNNTGNFAAALMHIGGRSGQFAKMDLARAILFNRKLTDSEFTQVNNYLMALYAIGIYDGVSGFSENAYADQVLGIDNKYFIQTSDGARLVYTTEATNVVVGIYNDLFVTYPTLTEIGVRVDGVDLTAIAPGAGGNVGVSLDLAAGAKTVEFINGLQSAVGGVLPRRGTFIRNLKFNAAATQIVPTSTPKILIFGDSISSGQAATHPSLEGWAQLVRNDYVGAVQFETYGVASLFLVGSTAQKRTDFAQLLANQSPATIWLAIGTNDYGLELWSAADFGTAYADLLVKLHAVLPSAVIYAQTPIDRTVETEIEAGFGALGDYRTAIATAVSGKEAYCTLVDGSAWTIELDGSGVHPTTVGHAAYADAVKTVLEIA